MPWNGSNRLGPAASSPSRPMLARSASRAGSGTLKTSILWVAARTSTSVCAAETRLSPSRNKLFANWSELLCIDARL
ncbi:hypothetical protein BE11_43370 [Sorangium cellulosum]|nr:hypothetical protein BE11_43370 [Sorangium cellulosum]